jgi:hypothetical protein
MPGSMALVSLPPHKFRVRHVVFDFLEIKYDVGVATNGKAFMFGFMKIGQLVEMLKDPRGHARAQTHTQYGDLVRS